MGTQHDFSVCQYQLVGGQDLPLMKERELGSYRLQMGVDLRRRGARVANSAARKTAALGRIVKFLLTTFFASDEGRGEDGGSEDEEHSKRAFESHQDHKREGKSEGEKAAIESQL